MDVPTCTYDLGSSVISYVHSMKLLGVATDKDLNFTEHVADIVHRVSNQIQVMQRHKKLINTETKTKLCNAYLLPHLYYCSVLSHHCGQGNLKKLELMNVAYDSFSMTLTVIINYYLIVWDNHNYGHVHYILTLVHKSLIGPAPEYVTNMFSYKTHSINLRSSGTYSLFIPCVNTTLSYGSKLMELPSQYHQVSANSCTFQIDYS